MNYKKIKTKKNILIGLAILAIVVLLSLELTSTINLFGSDTIVDDVTTSTGQETKGEIENRETTPQNQNSTNQSNDVQKNTNKDGGSNNESSQGTLSQAPTGTFVSNHSPNLGGAPAPNTENSTCVTTPGATCTIKFTKDGVTKSLQSKIADSEGIAYWTWKLQNIGLTEGSWKISAEATLNGSSKQTNDVIDLMVGS